MNDDSNDFDVGRRRFLQLTGAGTVLLSVGTRATLASEDDLRKAAMEHVAERIGADVSDLAVVNEAVASWSTLGETYYNAKVHDTSGGGVHQALLDGDGDPVDREQLDRREWAAYRERYGKLEKDLHRKVQELDDHEEMEVVVWLEPIDHEAAKQAVDLDERPNTAETKDALSAEYRRRIDARTKAFVERVEDRSDVEVLNTGYGSTTVDLRTTISAVDRVQEIDLVERINDRDFDRTLPLSSATRTHGTADAYGDPKYDLSGYKVGHAEFAHPESGVEINYGGKRWDGDPGPHSAFTAECLASRDKDLPGTASRADVYSADKIFNKLSDRFEGFDDQDVVAVNTSVGWVTTANSVTATSSTASRYTTTGRTFRLRRQPWRRRRERQRQHAGPRLQPELGRGHHEQG